MASPPKGAAATAEPPSSPRFEQHHEQRPNGSPLSSPGGSLSAPHSTVADASEATPGTSLAPLSPDSGSSCSPVIGSAAPVWPARPKPPGVSCSSAPGWGNDGSESEGRKDDATTTVVLVDPEVPRRNADVDVEAGSGAVVRWVCRSAGEGGSEGAGDGRDALALSGGGRSVDWQEQQEEAGGDRERTEEPALSGAPSSTNLTVTIVSDKVDEPQVTCQVPQNSGCCEKIFDRPGSYTYYVCSGPLTMGRVVATAPKDQPQSAAIAVASSPPACLKGSDAGEEGVEDLAVLGAASMKSDTAVDGYSAVCASQDERECRSAAREECNQEMVKAGDYLGQHLERGASHEAAAADILDVADAKQFPLEPASLEGGQCTAVDGHSSEVCASQDEGGCHSAATEEGDPETVKTGDLPGQGQEPGIADEAAAADVLDVADAKQSPLECAFLEGGECTAVGGHSSKVCALKAERECRSAATEESDPETVKAGDSPGQDQEPGVAHEAVAAILDVAHATQSALEGAVLPAFSSQGAAVEGHSSEVCASQDGSECHSASTEECGSKMVKTGGLPGQDQEHGVCHEAVAVNILDLASAKQFPLEPASLEGGQCPAVDGHSSEVCASQDEGESHSAATEEGDPEMVKTGGLPGQDQEPGVAHEAAAATILDVTDAKQSALEGGKILTLSSQGAAADGRSSDVCALQDERDCHSAATEECASEMVKTGDPPGQDQEPGVAHEAVAADILDVADAKQSPLEIAEMPTLRSQDSLEGEQCTAADDHSSDVCASQDEMECCSATTEQCDSEMVSTGGLPGQDQDHSVSHDTVAADILDVDDAKQSPLEGAEMLSLCSQDTLEGEQCTAADGHSSAVCASQDDRECRSAAAKECDSEMVRTEGLPGQDQERDVAHKAAAADVLDMADAKQSPLESATVLSLSSQGSLGGRQCVDTALCGAEEVAEQTAGEEPGAQSSCDGSASESRVEEKQAPNHQPPSVPLSPGEGNSERWPLQGADQEGQAPNHPSLGLTISPGEGNSELLPLQGAEQDGSSLVGFPELESGGNGNQPPASAVAACLGPTQREGDCEGGEGVEGTGDDVVRRAVDHRREIGTEVGMYISSPGSDADRTITPQTHSPASIRRGTVDDVVSQPSDGGGDSALSDIAVFGEGGPCQDIAAHEGTTAGPRDVFPSQQLQALMTPDHTEEIFASGGGGSNSYDSDDVPRASCVGDGDNPNVDKGKRAWERLSPPVSPPTPLSVLPTTDTPNRARGGTSLRPAGSAMALQPQRSPQEGRVGRHRVEVMQRDGAGQWKEISPLTSPAAAGGPGSSFGAFICSEDSVSLPPPIAGDHKRKEQRSDKTIETAHAVDGAGEKATPSVLEEAEVVAAAVVAPMLEVDNESEGTMQTAMEALDVSDSEDSTKASRAISPSTLPPPVGTEENVGDVSSDSADEAAAESDTAPNESEGAARTAIETLDVSDGDDSAKASRAISPSTTPPPMGAEENLGDVSSDSACEAAAELGTAPNESEGTTRTAMEALDVSDGECSVKASRAMSPSTAPPPVGAEENVGDVVSDSTDETAAKPGTAPNESEGTLQTAMEALDVSDGDGSAKAISPSTAPPPVGTEENVGDVSSDSADEAAAEPGTAPNESKGTAQAAIEALDVSDGDGSAKASRAMSPSTAPPPMGTEENIDDVSSDSADEAAAETGTAPNESESAAQTVMGARDVSDGDGSAKASRAISPSTAPPVGAEENIDDVPSDFADEAAAEPGTAPNESKGTMQTTMEALDVSDGDSSAKASRAISPSAAPPVGAEEHIGDVSSDSTDEAAAETGTAPNESEGTMPTAVGALDVSEGDGSAKASCAISPSTAPPVGAEENIDDVPSDFADEAAVEPGTAPNESKGTMQTTMEALDVSDNDGSAKALRAISPSAAPPVGAEEHIGDVSSDSTDEVAAESGTAPNESEGTIQTAVGALDVSDGDGSAKASRAISPSTGPPVGADDVPSGFADEAAAEPGTTPNKSEGTVQTAMGALDVSDGDGSAKASCAISPSTAPPPVVAEQNSDDVSSDYFAGEAAAETGAAPNESEGTTRTAMETLDVSDSDGSAKASRAISPSTAPRMDADELIGDVPSDSADEAVAEAGTAPASPVDGDLPHLPTGSVVNADAYEGDQCCESVVTPLSSAAVESSDVAQDSSAENASPASSNVENGVECGVDGIHTIVVGDNSMQPFQPEVVRVPVGARVMWKRCSGAANDDEPEVFNVRQGCPIVETGWRTEFSFSIGGAQPTFVGTFERAGRFVISSDASPPGADRKRGEVVVESDAGHSESDSFASPDDVRTSSEGFVSGNEGSSFTPVGEHEGGFGDGSLHLTPSSVAMSPRAPQGLNSNSCRSSVSDDTEGRDCEDQDLVAAPPTESSGDLHNSATTTEPVRNCVMPASFLAGIAISPGVAVTGIEMRTVEPVLPTRRRRPRSLPPISGAHGMSHSGRRALSDGRGWIPPDRLGAIEWSKGSYVTSEMQRSHVAATSHECLRSPHLLSDTHAPAAMPTVNGKEPSRGGGGGGGGDGADNGRDCGFSDTDVDDDRQSPTSAFVVQDELRADASIQVEESLPSVASACTRSTAPNGGDELEEPPQRAWEADGTVQVEVEGEDVVVASSARSREDESAGQPPPKTSQSKKKKKKKQKKKSGGGGGGGGNGLGGERGGSRTSRGSSADTSKIPAGEGNSALLLDEEAFSELLGDNATGFGGGSGKTSAKTLIVGDQGFKPWKPVLVQVGATVSIKAANVWPNGGIGQDRALSISLVGPIVPNEETRRFFEGSNKLEDMPRESRFRKTAPSGRALVAVFRKHGEYWLVDHLAGKRIKVTAVAREAAPAAAQVEPGLPTPSGKQVSTSLPLDAEGAEATQRRGGHNGGEVISRSKKKSRGNDKLGEPTALVKGYDATPPVEGPAVVLTSSEVAGSAGVRASGRDVDLSPNNARGVVDGGSGEERATTSPTTDEHDLLGQAQEPSPPLLPPIRVMREGDLSLDDFAWFTKFDAVHVVRVSHKKGFEPASLEMGLSPGLGALVVCELDAKQRVTREVLCRWLLGGAGDASGAATGREEVEAGTSSRVLAAGNGAEADTQMELSTRLGPGSLKNCHFVLGRFGEYRLSYRSDAKRGLAVVIKPPSVGLASLVSTSASDTSVAREAGFEADSVHRSSQVQHPKGPRTRRLRDQMLETAECNSSSEVAGEDGSPDSAEAPSDEDSAAMSGSTASSAEIASHVGCPIDGSGLTSTHVQQDVAEHKVVTLAAVGGGGFCWEDAMSDRDQDQGDFVQQRSHVKRIKRHKIKSERAEAAKNAAAAAALLEAAEATAGAAAAESTVGKPTHLEEADLTAGSAVPTGPSASEKGMPTATGLPTEKPALEESRTNKNLIWEANLGETSAQRATATDKVSSSVNSCLDQKPSNSPAVPAKADLEPFSSPGVAVVATDAPTSLAVESSRVEPTATRPTSLGRRKARKHFSGESIDSPSGSAPTEPVAVAATGLKKTQRKREERKSGGVHIAASARNSAGVTSIEPAQETPVTEETVATVTGWGVAVLGASWSDNVGPTQSEVRVGVLTEGCNAPRAARGAPRPYAHQSPAAPPRVPHRRWDVPQAAAVFSQPHAPPQSSHRRGWNVPTSGGSATPVNSNWKGSSAAAPLGSMGDHSYSPSCAGSDGWGVTQKGGRGAAQDGLGSVALASSPAEVPGLTGSAQTVEVPAIVDSKEKARAANQPSAYSHQGNVVGGAASSAEAPGVVAGGGSLPGAHLMAGDRATDSSHEESGGYGRRSRSGTESTRASSRTSAHSRSGSFSSGPSDPSPSTGSNVPTSGKHKSKKKARAERKAANAAAGAAGVEAAFSGEPRSSAGLEPSAGQPHAASAKTTARAAKARKSDSHTGSSSRSGISFGDFVLPVKAAVSRAGAFGPSASGRRDVAGDRALASTSGSSGRAGAECGRGGEGSGVEEKKVAAGGGGAKFGQASRGRPGPARSETAGGWRAEAAPPVPKPVSARASASPIGLGDGPARPPSYKQPAEKEDGSAPEGGAVGDPETPEGGAALATEVVASPTTAPSPKTSNPPGEKNDKPRWGNCSTTVSFEERSRRSQALRGTRLPRGHRKETRSRSRPAAFPEASRLPGGGYSVPEGSEGSEDRLPPPSAYELEESARMMKVYDDMVERLNTTGLDEELPNGFTPKIYDLTNG